MNPVDDEGVDGKKENSTKVCDILHHKDDEQQPQKGVIILRGKVRNDATKKEWYLEQLDGQDVSSLRSGNAGGIGAYNTNGLNRVLDHVALAVGGSHGSIPQHLDVADRKDAIMAKAEGWTDDEQAELRAAIDSQKDNLKAVMKKLQEEVARRLGRGDEQALATPNIRVINLHSSKFGANDFAHAMGAVVETE